MIDLFFMHFGPAGGCFCNDESVKSVYQTTTCIAMSLDFLSIQEER